MAMITAAMGVLKVAAMPAAAPQARRTFRSTAVVGMICPNSDPIAPPVWMMGPSAPNGPPVPIATAVAIGLIVATFVTANGERLPLPAKGARLLFAQSYFRAEQVSIERPDFTTWLEWSLIPDTELSFETRKPGIVDVTYVCTSAYDVGVDLSGPAGMSIEIDGTRVNAVESRTEGFDVESLGLGETDSLYPVLRWRAPYTFRALVAIPAGNHVVRMVMRPAGNVNRHFDGLFYTSGEGTILENQTLTVLVFG